MKTFHSLLLVLFFSVPLFASEKQDYKCFVKSTDGDKIVFYRWQVKEIKLNIATLVGRTNKNNKGKTYYIKTVDECVTIEQDFNAIDAQKMDKITVY
ncbi:hypothetical protein HQQ94_06025 [Shewanella sp. VB17]|uniref:TapY2 family type IVa secretion system protein n=1 Tax=Shewanella sp. VB17 TaxID=2739432 RepID=UPI0015635406|nr:TapY2 family type IVa secretion system protein [Shewanella sp. VB17]NRD72812.1 hypothetical protein [Shewanella sp. VB17]